MSRFIFTSLGVRNEIVSEKMRDMFDMSKRVLIIPCAAGNETLTAKVEKDALCKLGFLPNKVYSFDKASPKRYKNIFFDYIYVPGGNQYKLLAEIREFDLSEHIRFCIDKDAVYIGISAGAYVATDNIRYCLELEPNDKYPLDDYTSLGLVESNIICHYNHYGQDEYKRVKSISGRKEIITINDDMVIEI